MRKIGICVLLAGAVASFPAVQAQDVVADDAPPVDSAVPADESVGAVDDGTAPVTGIEEGVETLPTELVDPQPGDDGQVVDDSGEVVDDGGEIVDDGGEVIDDGGEVVDDGGEVIDDGGEIVDDGGEVVDDGGEVIDDGGEIVDNGGEVIDDSGEIADDGGEVIDGDGEIIDDAGEIVDDGVEVIVDGGEIKVGDGIGDGTVGEVIYYTMTPGDAVNSEVVRDVTTSGGDPVPVEGQLPAGDGLVYATGAPDMGTATAGPLESRDTTSETADTADTALPAEVDDATRVNGALPADFPAPMDVIDTERTTY